MPKRRSYVRDKPFLLTNPEYRKDYCDLEKDYRKWNGMSQYLMAQECKRRMDALMHGNLAEFNKVVHSEHLLLKTKRLW
jgi:hypothetical protein